MSWYSLSTSTSSVGCLPLRARISSLLRFHHCVRKLRRGQKNKPTSLAWTQEKPYIYAGDPLVK